MERNFAPEGKYPTLELIFIEFGLQMDARMAKTSEDIGME